MIIIGAGLAGLLTANILHRNKPKVFEKQSELPNNHKALLRHREKLIADAVGIQFKEVSVTKQINYKGEFYNYCLPRMANEYSLKVTGKYLNRSITNINPVQRYIAPENFIQQLSESCEIYYNEDITKEKIENLREYKNPVISTIPLPTLLNILQETNHGIDFKYKNIFTLTANILDPYCDLYQTTYYPNINLSMYRMSITGDKVICEFIEEPIFYAYERHGVNNDISFLQHFLERDFGIFNCDLTNVNITESKYGKIVDIDSAKRKQIIRNLTLKYNIYSVGRYATWRNILLDDVYKDIQIVKNLIDSKGYYTGD